MPCDAYRTFPEAALGLPVSVHSQDFEPRS